MNGAECSLTCLFPGRYQAEYEGALARQAEAAMTQLEEIKAARQQREEYVETIARQRDMYRAMLQNATTGGGGTATGGAGEGVGQLTAAGPAAPSGPDYMAMLADAQKEAERVKMESLENTRILHEQMAALRAEASEARHAGTRAAADMEFHRQRYNRLVESSDATRAQTELLVQRNASLAKEMTDHQKALQNAMHLRNAAEDESRRQMRVISGLEAEKALLTQAEARIAAELKTLSEDRTKLATKLEVLKATTEMREQERRVEMERFQAEKARLEKEWATDRAELEREKTRCRQVEATAKEEVTGERVKLEAVQKEAGLAKEAKAAAKKTVEVLEVRNSSLASSLAKAEESVRLALARGPGSDDGVGGGGGPKTSGAREKELLAVAMEAKEELGSAQESAAAAAAHAAHFKAIAEKNEECLKDMEAAHAAFQSESAKTSERAAADYAALQAKCAKAEHQLAEAGGRLAEVERELAEAETGARGELARAQAEAAASGAEVKAATDKAQQLQEDAERYLAQWRSAKSCYEQELLQHAETIKKLHAAEAEADESRTDLRAVTAKQQDASSALAIAMVSWESEKAALEDVKQRAEAKQQELELQNRHLHEQMEAFTKHASENFFQATAADNADGTAAGDNGNKQQSHLAEVVAYLRREKDTVECRLQLKEQELARVSQQCQFAVREADSVRAQLVVETERARAAVKAEAEQAQLMQQIQHLNLLRESNATLRKENEQHLVSLRTLQVKAAAGLIVSCMRLNVP
jgi:nucleoprotein TPR